jgi:hypothetical protein
MADAVGGMDRNNETARDKPGETKDLTLKEAHSLLATAKPAAVLSLLKNPDFAMIAGIAFMGFRVDARSYANPLVRRRLAEEAVRNNAFAQDLRSLAVEARAVPSTSAPRPVAQKAQPTHPPTPPNSDSSEKYRAERDRLRQERDTAIEARRIAERDYGKARADQLAAETARAEAEREAERLRQRLERQERRLRRLESENAALSRATASAHSPARSPREDAAHERPSLADKPSQSEQRFVAAVRHLLDKEKWALAAQLASDVLRSAPGDPEALAIRARAEQRQGHINEAMADLRRLIPAETARGEAGRALQSLFELLGMSSRPASEAKLIREVYAVLAAKPSEIPGAREILDRMRTTAPSSYLLMKDYARDDLAQSLFGPSGSGSLAPDDPLPLPSRPLHGITLTARRLIAAIDRNDISLVNSAREAMLGMGAEDLQPLERALVGASGGDGSYFQLLVRSGAAGAVVVDASNVAWHGQEMVVGGKPRIAHLLALRAALRERGYFPILMIADANLPYVIDDTAKTRQMERDGELTLTPSGTDADEYILREARRLHAPVVTNDYMADWDPDQKIGKVQYDISLVDGRATLYF